MEMDQAVEVLRSLRDDLGNRAYDPVVGDQRIAIRVVLDRLEALERSIPGASSVPLRAEWADHPRVNIPGMMGGVSILPDDPVQVETIRAAAIIVGDGSAPSHIRDMACSFLSRKFGGDIPGDLRRMAEELVERSNHGKES